MIGEKKTLATITDDGDRTLRFSSRVTPGENHNTMALTQTSLKDLSLIARGKVRDIYSIPSDPNSLLFVATDRVFPASAQAKLF
jgi:hypothetical protein